MVPKGGLEYNWHQTSNLLVFKVFFSNFSGRPHLSHLSMVKIPSIVASNIEKMSPAQHIERTYQYHFIAILARIFRIQNDQRANYSKKTSLHLGDCPDFARTPHSEQRRRGIQEKGIISKISGFPDEPGNDEL
jgi:hypothetical protein